MASPFAGFYNALGNISKSTKKVASTTRKPVGSGVGRVANQASKAVTRAAGNSVSRSAPRRNTSSRSSNSTRGVSASTPRRVSAPPRPAPRPASGASSSGMIAATQTPPPVSIEQWLANDTTFKGQQASYKTALDDYLAQYQAELQKYGNEYQAGVDKVGLERETGVTDLQNDYASRGLLQSGVFGEALNKYNSDMDTRLADMSRAKSAFESDQSTAKTNFQKEQEQLVAKARQDALNRRLDTIRI